MPCIEALTERELIQQMHKLDFNIILPNRNLSESTLHELLEHVGIELIISTQKLSLNFILQYVIKNFGDYEVFEHILTLTRIYQGYTEEDFHNELQKLRIEVNEMLQQQNIHENNGW